MFPSSPDQNRWLFPYLVGNSPSYFIYGPMVFTEATINYVKHLLMEMARRNARLCQPG